MISIVCRKEAIFCFLFTMVTDKSLSVAHIGSHRLTWLTQAHRALSPSSPNQPISNHQSTKLKLSHIALQFIRINRFSQSDRLRYDRSL